MAAKPVVLVVMGVSGSGKTTVATTLLAARLGWPFEEGDSLPPKAKLDKMRSGRALTDGDRRVWLARVAHWIDECVARGENGLITCSALKRSYREVINRRGSGVVFVYLAGSRELVAARLAGRTGHFMPPSLLESQLSDLEEPTVDEPAIRIDVDAPPSSIAGAVLERLALPD